MECGRAILLTLLYLALSAAIHVEARSLKRKVPDDRDHSLTAIQVNEALSQKRISPDLDPESSKKFFKKDYPSDARPGVDVLHFKHPYPVVQDSGEFDNDYVKDENTDNGHWKAQQEYDRLRHKLKQEKEEADKAFARKAEEERELKRAMEKYQGEKDKNEEAKKRAAAEAAAKAKAKAKPKAEENQGSWSWNWDWWPFSWPKWNWPESEKKPAKKSVDENTGIRGATKDTEKAMDNLEDCKEELARARAQLKKVMDELEEAKAKQAAEDAEAAAAAQKHTDARKLTNSLTKKSSSEEAEYTAAKEAYLKQEALVDKLQADLDAAAAKVKAYRDAEDKGGGVYNTKDPVKSMTSSMGSPQVLVLLAISLALSHRF